MLVLKTTVHVGGTVEVTLEKRDGKEFSDEYSILNKKAIYYKFDLGLTSLSGPLWGGGVENV